MSHGEPGERQHEASTGQSDAYAPNSRSGDSQSTHADAARGRRLELLTAGLTDVERHRIDAMVDTEGYEDKPPSRPLPGDTPPAGDPRLASHETPSAASDPKRIQSEGAQRQDAAPPPVAPCPCYGDAYRAYGYGHPGYGYDSAPHLGYGHPYAGGHGQPPPPVGYGGYYDPYGYGAAGYGYGYGAYGHQSPPPPAGGYGYSYGYGGCGHQPPPPPPPGGPPPPPPSDFAGVYNGQTQGVQTSSGSNWSGRPDPNGVTEHRPRSQEPEPQGSEDAERHRQVASKRHEDNADDMQTHSDRRAGDTGDHKNDRRHDDGRQMQQSRREDDQHGWSKSSWSEVEKGRENSWNNGSSWSDAEKGRENSWNDGWHKDDKWSSNDWNKKDSWHDTQSGWRDDDQNKSAAWQTWDQGSSRKRSRSPRREKCANENFNAAEANGFAQRPAPQDAAQLSHEQGPCLPQGGQARSLDFDGKAALSMQGRGVPVPPKVANAPRPEEIEAAAEIAKVANAPRQEESEVSAEIVKARMPIVPPWEILFGKALGAATTPPPAVTPPAAPPAVAVAAPKAPLVVRPPANATIPRVVAPPASV